MEVLGKKRCVEVLGKKRCVEVLDRSKRGKRGQNIEVEFK